MRGRKRIENSVLKLRGSGELNRRSRNVPPPAKNIQRLDPPEPFTDTESAALWASVTKYMAKQGTLGQVSAHCLRRYIDLLRMWQTIESKAENVQQAIAIQCRLSPCLSKMEAQLGLTPADRRSVTPAAPEPKKKDPLRALIGE
jgi:phage terminase small subunit